MTSTAFNKHALIGLFIFILATGHAFAEQPPNRTAFSQVATGLSSEEQLDFTIGKGLFKRLWVSAPASTQAADGLGPLYNARACMTCHPANGRGKPPSSPGESAVSMFLRIDIPPQNAKQARQVEQHQLNNIPDPVYGLQLQHFAVAGQAAEYQLQINYTEFPIELSDGVTVNLRKPAYQAIDLGYGPLHPQARLSPRVAPQMIGLGLLDKIEASDIETYADLQHSNNVNISGRTNLVWSHEFNQVMLGRFGYKAGSPSINEQTQAAFSNDIGISTPMLSKGYGECTEKQKSCINAPDGNSPQYENLEAPQQVIDLVNLYVRNIAVPEQRSPNDSDFKQGEALFKNIGCNQCHRESYNITHNGQKKIIKPYTDLLLHDMGSGLADNRPEGRANGQEWRTAPLWGIGLTPNVTGNSFYLHDGRARNLLEAILWHGGEAQQQRDAVIALNNKQRNYLLKFLESI